MESELDLQGIVERVPQLPAVLCKLLGVLFSPGNILGSRQLLRPMAGKLIPGGLTDEDEDQINAWFEPGEESRICDDVAPVLAPLVVDEARRIGHARAVWAVAAFKPQDVVELMRGWSCEEVDAWCYAAIELIADYCGRDEVLDLRRGGRGYPAGARLTKDAFSGATELEIFGRISRFNPELLHYGIARSIETIVELVVSLRPDHVAKLIVSARHPVIRLWIGWLSNSLRLADHRYTLSWFEGGADPSVIALAVFETFGTVNRLSSDQRTASRADWTSQVWSTELDASACNVEEYAHRLLEDLVARLCALPDEAAITWVARALDQAPVLLAIGNNESQTGLDVFVTACVRASAEIFGRTDNRQLALAAFESALRARARRATVLCSITAALGDRDRALREQIYEKIRTSLDEEVMSSDREYRGDHPKWTLALAHAIALSEEIDDPLGWLLDYARVLPLSGWDAEERSSKFHVASGALAHIFQIGFIIIRELAKRGRTLPSEHVMSFVDIYWRSASFFDDVQRTGFRRYAGLLQENAMLCATMYANQGDVWLLGAMGYPGIEPPGLTRGLELIRNDEARVQALEHLCRVFDTEQPEGRERLFEWGRLALKMFSVTRALPAQERAREDLLRSCTGIAARISDQLGLKPHRESSRAYWILGIELAIIAASRREGADTCRDLKEHAKALYSRLWTYDVPDDETEDKARVDALRDTLNIELQIRKI